MEEAADLLYGLLSPELYLLFAKERGRAGERWERRRMRPGRPERRVVGFTRVENRTESYIETQTSCGLASEQTYPAGGRKIDFSPFFGAGPCATHVPSC